MTSEQALQMQVLTGLMSYRDSDGWLCSNPFYQCNVDGVLRNREKARRVWSDLWRKFSSKWVLSKLEDRGYTEETLIGMSQEGIDRLVTEKDVPLNLTEFKF